MAVVEIIEANLIDNQKKEKKLKRACAYCRVSTDEEEQLTSYNSQIEYYSKMIKNDPELTFVGVYADEGITGTQMKNRDDFLRMIEDAKKGLIDVVIAKSISRFARNTVDTLNTCRLLRELNVDVYFEKENIHTLYMDSEMFLTLYSAFAQAESESTSQNVRMGYRAKMKRGEPCGSIACYGFNWNKITKELTINEAEASVVRKIFDYYVSLGLGTSRICKKLESEGIKAPKGGKRWSPSVIKDILRNIKYIGDVMGQKYYVENPLTHKLVRNRGEKPKYHSKNHHEAIVDKKIWDKAQEIYEKRSQKIKNGQTYCEKYSIRYPYSSKIECGICHRNYVRRQGSSTYNNEKRYHKIYWKCSEYISKSGECDASAGLREDELNDMFVQLFNEISTYFNCSDEILFKKIESAIYDNRDYNELKKLESEEIKIRKKILHLIDLKLEDESVLELYEEKEENLKQELQEIKRKKEEITSLLNNRQITQERINQIKETLKNTKKLEEFNPEIFENLIERIYIGEISEDSTKDYSVIRFVLKTGELAKYYRGTTKKTPKKIMSFEPSGRFNESPKM